MKHFKHIVGVFTFFVSSVLLLQSNVFGISNEDDIIRKLAPDGQNAVFKMKKPTSPEEGDANVNGYVNGYINNVLHENGYVVFAGCEEPYTTCTINIAAMPAEQFKSYNINVTFDEPKSNPIVNNYISKLNNFSATDPTTYYTIEDLSLINYYLTSRKSELYNPGAPGRALKYSSINNVTSGSNVSYYLEIRAGNANETLMYESAFGPMTILYDGHSYGTKTEGLYLKRVLYIPQSTADSKEAYIAAAQKRINDYLGNNSVVVSYGGLINSLPDGSEDQEYPIASDGNYYNVTVGDKTYKFYIVKGTEKQLAEPKYAGMDIESKIEISSEDSTIPLDTSVTVKNVNDSTIKDKIGTSNYKSYDISLFSDAKNSKIEKLANGKFLVKIPIPTDLTGKTLTVYYINEGNKEEHEVTINNGYATFETNHFSVYTLAEKSDSSYTLDEKSNSESSESDVKNPKTGDNILGNAVILGISTFGLIALSIYLKIKKISI